MESVEAEIKQCLDEVIRPTVQEDGGDIEFIEFDPSSGIVKLSMKGACVGCPHSQVTLKRGIEAFLIEMFEGQVKEVVQV